MNQQVKLSTATTLRFQATEGRATSATITIKDSDNNDLVTAVSAATATVDPVNTTVDANCGASSSNKRKVSLAATTNIRVGGMYLLTDSTGHTEWVTVKSIASGDYVIVKDDLVYDYVSPNTFVGTELTYALTAGNAQDTSGDCAKDFRCEWTYTVSGTVYVRETLYDVTRHPWFRLATTAGLKQWNADLFSLFDRETGRDWDDDLEAAFQRVVERLSNRVDIGAALGMDKLVVPTYCMLALNKGIAGIMPSYAQQDPMGYIEARRKDLDEALDGAGITWVDTDQDNAKTTSEVGSALIVRRMTT